MAERKAVIISHGPERTREIAQSVGAAMPAGAVIAAQGDLGAGKTLFAAALAVGLGVKEVVNSPTFIYFQDYQGRIPFCHIDAYRLEDMDGEEKALIGLDDCFSADKAALAEWPDFIQEWLPRDAIRLEIRRSSDNEADDNERELVFSWDDEAHPWLGVVLCV